MSDYQIDNYKVDIYEWFTIPSVTLMLCIDGDITSIKVDNCFILMPKVIYLDARGDEGDGLLDLPKLAVKRVLAKLRSLMRDSSRERVRVPHMIVS